MMIAPSSSLRSSSNRFASSLALPSAAARKPEIA
jgi:hypothetical protein